MATVRATPVPILQSQVKLILSRNRLTLHLQISYLDDVVDVTLDSECGDNLSNYVTML